MYLINQSFNYLINDCVSIKFFDFQRNVILLYSNSIEC